MYIVRFLRVTVTCTHLIIGWVEPDASVSMFVGLVVRVLLEQEVGTVAVDGGGLLGQAALLTDVQSFEVSLQSSLVVIEVLVVVLCLGIQLSNNLLLYRGECEVCAYPNIILLWLLITWV